MIPEVRLEAEALDDRQKRLHQEDGRARLGHVRCHVASPLGQHRVDG